MVRSVTFPVSTTFPGKGGGLTDGPVGVSLPPHAGASTRSSMMDHGHFLNTVTSVKTGRDIGLRSIVEITSSRVPRRAERYQYRLPRPGSTAGHSLPGSGLKNFWNVQCAMRFPSRRASTSALRKWIPSRIRPSTTSSAACEKRV